MSRVSGVAELVRLMVLSGEIRPGERVNEPRLMQSLRVRRGTLREALRLLEGRGLLVGDESGGMRAIDPDAADVQGALEVRAALEGLCAAAAADRRRRGELARAALDEVAEVAAGDDRRFHLALAALAGNRAARRALDRQWDRLLVAGVAARDADDHRALLATVDAGDAEAAGAFARRHALAATGPPAPPSGTRTAPSRPG